MKYIGTIIGPVVAVAWVMGGVALFYNDAYHWEQAYWMTPLAVAIGVFAGVAFDVWRK